MVGCLKSRQFQWGFNGDTIGIGDTRPGKRLHNYGKSPFFMGKATISMAIFNSYVKLPEGRFPSDEMGPSESRTQNSLRSQQWWMIALRVHRNRLRAPRKFRDELQEEVLQVHLDNGVLLKECLDY